MNLASSSMTYCKTQCDDPCAEHASMYGKLCCEWDNSSSSDKTCGLTVANNICTCGASDSGAPAPAKPPTATPPPPPKHHKNPTDDDAKSDDFPPFEPFPPFAPFPPFKPFPPFEPIHVPDGATPCKKTCTHACGWSQSDGKTLCCDKADNTCSITQINGKCYCSK